MQVGSHVREQLWEQVWMQVSKQVIIFKRKRCNYLFYGRRDAGFFAFYDFLNEVLDIKYPETWFIYKRITELGFIILFDGSSIVVDRPEQISTKDGELHNENGMAIKYRNGRGVYILNGVRVTKEIVETPADKLAPEIILRENNAEVRLEIVRRIEADKLASEIILKERNAEVRREIVRKCIPAVK